MNFSINDELLRLQDEDVFIPNETKVLALSAKDTDSTLNDIVDRIEESSDAIADPEVFDCIRSFVKNSSRLKTTVNDRIIDIVISGFQSAIANTEKDLQDGSHASYEDNRGLLERYAFLLYWLIWSSENATTSRRAAEKGMTTAKVKKGRKAKDGEELDDNADGWDWAHHNHWKKPLELILCVLNLKLGRIWTSAPELETFLSLFTKPSYQILESPLHTKDISIKQHVYAIIGSCVQNYGQSFAAQTSVLQKLQYYEHSAESMAELLDCLCTRHDNTQVGNEVLSAISKQFSASRRDQSDSTFPKTVAKFLVNLSALSPKTVLKQIVLLTRLLNSESYTIRMAIIEVIGNLVLYLSKADEEKDSDHCASKIDGFFDIIEERFRDENSYCRAKAIEVCDTLCQLREKSSMFILFGYTDAPSEISKNVRVLISKRWRRIIDLTIDRLEDKSFVVRKKAIILLTNLLKTHPYIVDGGHINLEEMTAKLQSFDDTLKALIPQLATGDDSQQQLAALTRKAEQSEEIEMNEETQNENADVGHDAEMMDLDDEVDELDHLLDDDVMPTATTPLDMTETADSDLGKKVLQTRALRSYYVDVIHFIEQLNRAIVTLCQLLGSTNKGEVITAMDFFVCANEYKVEAAKEGVSKMLHLIWSKDASGNDEVKSVRNHLVDCYNRLYIARAQNQSEKDYVNSVTRNLITLTFSMTLAELTSLEQLICTMVAHDVSPDRKGPLFIIPEVIQKLWSTYGSSEQLTKPQRRGAIIILGMMAKENKEIITEKVDLLMKIGLGNYGKEDLALAKYTCIALQRLGGSKKKQKGSLKNENIRFPINGAIFQKMVEMMEVATRSPEWFPLAEQIIGAVYLLGDQPDVLCTQIIQQKAAKVFQVKEQQTEDILTGCRKAQQNNENDVLTPSLTKDSQILGSEESATFVAPTFELAQLVFTVGHVALKQIVHLEAIETEWKRTKEAMKGKEQQKEPNGDDDLEAVAGTTEDDFADRVADVREHELLYGSKSLLAVFGPIVSQICANNTLYKDRILQSAATVALCKLMCVSCEYCREHLSLLFKILEKSMDPTNRSNIIIGLGDMAVCFNNLIDADITHLYNRLGDKDPYVKKNALMVLTFLILNGMVKVKGQIGEMAKCLEDEEKRISDLAKLFFTELASKENVVYNNLPDIISTLSAGENAVAEESFKRIMKFLFEQLVNKDPGARKTLPERQAENMVEKLCQRFPNATSSRQWRDISYCLSMLPYKSERSFKKLFENLPHYQDKLHDEIVYKNFMEVVTKKATKSEFKTIVDELRIKLEELHQLGQNELETLAAAATASRKAGATKARGVKDAVVKKRRGTTKKKIDEDSEESDELYECIKSEGKDADDDEMEEEDEEGFEKPKAPRRRANAGRAKELTDEEEEVIAKSKAPRRRGKALRVDDESSGELSTEEVTKAVERLSVSTRRLGMK